MDHASDYRPGSRELSTSTAKWRPRGGLSGDRVPSCRDADVPRPHGSKA